MYNNDSKKLETTGLGITVYGDAIVSGVVTAARLKVTGISTFATNTVINSTSIKVGSAVSIHTDGNAAFAGIVTANGGIHVGTAVTVDAETGNVAISGITTIGGNLYVTGDIVYDEITGRNLNITGLSTFANDVLFDNSTNANKDVLWDQSANKLEFSDDVYAKWGNGTDLQIYSDGTTAFIDGRDSTNILGISSVTATRLLGIHTSGDGGGIGIGSTTGHVGYGITYLNFKGPGVSTVSYTHLTLPTTPYV